MSSLEWEVEMWLWIEDSRFRCPACQGLISLKSLAKSKPEITSCDVIAVCDRCQRFYTAEEWRNHYGSTDKHQHIDF